MKRSYPVSGTSAEYWERFAKEDPYTYILTTVKDLNPAKFWESGQRTVQQELAPLLEARNVRTRLAMDLGCGLGRLVFPMSRLFRETIGADISDGMIQRARCFARDNSIHNVSFAAIEGPEDLLHQLAAYAGDVDFIYSLLVFQHIADFSMIEGYLHVISTLLDQNGTAYLQFDTRDRNLPYRVKTGLPDFILPWFLRRGVRRIRRSTEELEECFVRAGLEIAGELRPHTSYHRYILQRSRKVRVQG